MLQKAKVFFAKAVMVVLALSFLSWGANSYFSNQPQLAALKINGETITSKELESEYRTRLARAQSQFGSELSPEMLKALGLSNQVVTTMVQSKIALNEAKNLGFRASEDALKDIIKTNPAFQDANGDFNMDIYSRMVASYGYTISGYEKLMSEEMTKRNLYMLFETQLNAPEYLKSLYAYKNEAMSVRVLNINDEVLGELPSPSVADIKAYYDTNTSLFMSDEMRDINVLVLRADELTDRVNVSDEELLDIYSEHPESFTTREQRRASHILVPTEEKANDVIAKLKAGEKFEDLAKQVSTDAFTKDKGGDLGFFTDDSMVDAFSEAAFAMNVGETSKPVKSPFGFHVIKLMEIQAPKERTFEEVKEEIANNLKEERSIDLYYELQEKAQDLIAGGATLEEAAKELQLEVKTYQDVKANDISMTFATEFVPVAFMAEPHVVSQMIEIPGQETVVAFVEVTKITAQRELTLEEAQLKIVEKLKETARQKALGEKAEQLLVERQSSSSLEAVAKANNLSANITEISKVERSGAGAPAWLNKNAINMLFAKGKGQSLDTILNTPTGLALVEVIKREKPTANKEELEDFKEQMSRQLQEDLFAFYMFDKRNKADVEYNIPAIQAVVGNSFTPNN